MTDFEVKLYKKDIEQVVKSVSTLTEEITLHFDVEGITLRLMDSDHIALLDVSLPNAMFEKYKVESEFDIGVRTDDFEKMISMFDNDSSITISNNEKGSLILSTRNEKYTLKTIDAQKNDQPLPHLHYDSKVDFDQEITTKDFIKQLQKINKISDYVTFDTTVNKFTMSGKGDIGNAETNYERGQVSINVNDSDSKSKYSLDYILPFLKTVKDQSITLEYSSHKPLRLETKLCNIGRLHFYLAPRVEDT